MSNVNIIQNKISELEGGAFQNLFDAYLFKKYRFSNIQTLGVETGTNKPTKGTPDSYVRVDDGRYILINYGSVKNSPAEKIKSDILSCFDSAKLTLEKDKIRKIICGHGSTNIHIEQFNEIMETVEGVEIELIGMDTLSYDLAWRYPNIAKDYLGISIDTNQFFDIDDFVKAYDANGINAPIGCDFLHRTEELAAICKSIDDNIVTVLTGPSGIGKTRLALEVCRRFNKVERRILCVLSNGNLLYDDIKYYIDTPGKYLLFFDDANMVVSFDSVLNTLLGSPSGFDIRILITVRDYAKDRVIDTINKRAKPEIIEIGCFKDDEVKEILKNDLGIVNSHYLDKIAEIANGNIRLAFLAGMRSKEEGYNAIRCAEDIFRNYYGGIINDAKLSKDELILLFLVAISGPVRKSQNGLYSELKERYCEEIREDEIIEKMYSLELIDWFRGEITKVSDQSFGNFILYYVLYEKRWIDLESVIAIALPNYRQKVIYAIRTLIELFYSEALSRYVEESIIAAWNHSPENQEMVYLESFYQVYPEKALCIIKKHIDQEKTIDFDLHSFDIEKKKNNCHIDIKDIEILGGYKYTESFEDAVDLLLLYFQKRPDYVMDVYFSISQGLLFDKHSVANHFEKERKLVDKIWGTCESGNNYNNTILFLHIVKAVLKTEIQYIEESRNSRAVTFCRMPISFSADVADLRNKIWARLGELRKKDDYSSFVNAILSEVHFNGLYEDDSKKYLQSDFDAIFENVIPSKNLTFYDAKIINRYKEVAEQIGAPIDERFLKANDNNDFRVYLMLSKEHICGRTIEEDEEIRRNDIADGVSEYTIEDYCVLFKTCKFLEQIINVRDQWQLKSGLDVVFSLLEGDSEKYITVFKSYLYEGAPLQINGYKQIDYLLKKIGYLETRTMISDMTLRNKDRWLALIWECVDPNDMSEEIANDYKSFLLSNLGGDNPIVPNLRTIKAFCEIDEEIKVVISNALTNNGQLSRSLMSTIYHDEDIEIIMSIFGINMDALSQVYLNAKGIADNIDYEGKLFIKIFKQRKQIWEEYVNWLIDNDFEDGNNSEIFDLIWNEGNWKECIRYAFSNLIAPPSNYYIESAARLIFGKSSRQENMDRKKQWLFDELRDSIADVRRCRKILEVVVSAFPQMRMEYVLCFLAENKRMEDFKEIRLFPWYSSWSGSEVPLIIEEITFIEKLKEKLKGIEYIEHRNYLEEQKQQLEEYKRQVEIREYMNNLDYA